MDQALDPTAIRCKPLPSEFPGLHFIDDEEKEAVLRVLDAKRLYRYYGGDIPSEVESFEAEFASFLAVRYAVAVTSGTAALHTALAACGVGPGQEVIVPAYMWVSVVAAIINLGAIPIVADIDDSFCLDPRSVEQKITPRTSGIIVVHMNGVAADLTPIIELKRRHSLFLLEDCAQCVGGTYKGQPVGTFGDIATFSFQINKNMTSGEGGCVVTNDADLYHRCVAAHDAGYIRGKDGHPQTSRDLHVWGHGYRLDEIRGSILRVQLSKLPRVLDRMRTSKAKVRRFLETSTRIQLRRRPYPSGDTGGFLITSYADHETACSLSSGMRALGITSVYPTTSNVVLADYGLHIYSNMTCLVEKASHDRRGTPWTLDENRHSNPSYDHGACPVADDLFARSVLLTIPSCLQAEDEQDIMEAFAQVLGSVGYLR